MDLVWATCVAAVATKRSVTAANMSVLLYICTFLSTILIVDKNIPACVAYAIGSWLGTYFIVKRG